MSRRSSCQNDYLYFLALSNSKLKFENLFYFSFMSKLKSQTFDKTYESSGKTIIFFVFILFFYSIIYAVYKALLSGETNTKSMIFIF